MVRPSMADDPILPNVPRGVLDAPETIERAAIRYDGRVYAVPQPGRHCDVIRAIVAVGLADVVTGEQGFVTSSGRFVDRREARKIAEAAGQLLPRAFAAGRMLFSEDVW